MMDAIQLLQRRNSAPRLCEPAPSEPELLEIYAAAARAPDHARLKPWRIRLVRDDARDKLAALFIEAAGKRGAECGEKELEKMRLKTRRAPLIMVVSAAIVEHPKVPDIEQQLSAGCAAHAILLAVEALGYAGIWRTGANAFDRHVMDGLGMEKNEKIVGFLYIGSRDGNAKTITEQPPSEFVSEWT